MQYDDSASTTGAGFVQFILWVISLFFVFIVTAWNCDISIEKANLSQETCIKANSKAVSFDRTEVTCENKAVIPLKGD